MNNPNDVVQGKHLESVASGAKRCILAAIYDLSSAMLNDLPSDFSGATSVAGGASGLVPAPSAGDNEKFLRGDGNWTILTLGTTPSTVNGAIWLEDDT